MQNVPNYRHSPGLLAVVALAHAGVLSTLILNKQDAPLIQLRTLSVSLIEMREAQPEPPVKQPEQPKQSKSVLEPLTPQPVLSVERQTSAPLPATAVAEPPSPLPEPLSAILPAPSVAIAPKPAPAPPPVIEARFDADYLDNPKPSYPPLSRKLGEMGKVFLRVLVNPDGSVARLELNRSSGYERLDRSALNTVQEWRFVPARQGHQAISGWVIVPINFTLGS